MGNYDRINELVSKRHAVIEELYRAQSDKYDIEFQIKESVLENKMYDCMTINYNMLDKILNPRIILNFKSKNRC